MPIRPIGIIVVAFLLLFGFIFGIFTLIVAPLWLIDIGKEVLNDFYLVYLVYYSIFVFAAPPVAYGLLKGFKWAWKSSIILICMGIINSVLILHGFSIVLFLILIYYITRPNVKAYFE